MTNSKSDGSSKPNDEYSSQMDNAKMLADQDVLSQDIKSVYNTLRGTQDMLLLIQKKIQASPALNGGFDTLIQKMESFEKHQDRMVERVDEIHDAMYDPDGGLFARIKDTNVEILQIKFNQEKTESDVKKDLQDGSDMDVRIDKLDGRLKDMETSHSVIKWISITIGSGVILATIKAIYNFFVSHVKFL